MLAAAIGLSACGAGSDSAADDASATTAAVIPETTAAASEVAPVDDDEDHDDEDGDHDDEDGDHGDEDGDHGDEDGDHGDEDGDHGDEDGDHDDEDGDHDDEDGSLGAHEHGTADLSVAWIDAEVAINLTSPTFNVFGFEYVPTTDEDLAFETDRTEALSAAGVITINDEAGCMLADPVETTVERDGSHSEITVSWRFVCDDPDRVEELDASQLFAEFPNFEDIDAQWISESDQSAAELSPSATTLSLRR
ncbi:MAG: hypothetical protein ACJA14_002025 [Ilumatobacter sp.]|jgi:hypothetical protein